jgi:Ca-activated chloride channel family protein
MALPSWFRVPRVRRGLAAGAVVLAAGGLVLIRAEAARPGAPATPWLAPTLTPAGSNTTHFKGTGAHGTISLSQTRVAAGNDRPMYAEVRMAADRLAEARERAPLSLAVVLDTSGSMSGEKIEQAKDAVVRMIREMRDDDEVALVRYSSDASLVQPLARVGTVRGRLIDLVRDLTAEGGTNIPSGLSRGESALSEAGRGRVRRVILVSDGLDGSRVQSERLAKDDFERGITISSLGIGTDFDERYMAGVAEAGHGNFAFVRDGSSLASFLTRELKETASTVVENSRVRLQLPAGVRFVRAHGVDARQEGREVELKLGSLFVGDERRIIIDLESSLDDGAQVSFVPQASWDIVGGGHESVNPESLSVTATRDERVVEGSIDHGVLAAVTSVRASEVQMEAAEKFARGEREQALHLLERSRTDLRKAQASAPAAVAQGLGKQLDSLAASEGSYKREDPMAPSGKAAAKAAVADQFSNVGRAKY